METTVTINKSTFQKIDKFSKQNNCTKKDFLDASLSYFEKHGINPLCHESPSQEMQRLVRRVDQVIAFIRTQEKEFQRPALETIITSEERIKKLLFDIEKKEESNPNKLLLLSIKELESSLNEIKKGVAQLSDMIDNNNQSKPKKSFFS